MLRHNALVRLTFAVALTAVAGRSGSGSANADPAQTVHCIGAETEVRWGQLVLAAQDDRLAGWACRSATLQTPSGVTVGTPLSELERVYGSSLSAFRRTWTTHRASE